ncbi:MAG: helix-turn-helix domain-containing protein, partial [Candidatus Omnitrophica bacterium]|nr:helix-turn-helix domain-containing protein [Candidatus Omnitrophota bacterium]
MAEGGIITMRQEELRRLHIVQKVLDKKLKQVEAADKLNLSYRQIKRIIKRIKKEGDKGVIHRLRGQPSKRRIPNKIRTKVIGVYKDKYRDFGPTLASEMFFENEKITLSDETLRNWLIKEGLWQRRRKR